MQCGWCQHAHAVACRWSSKWFLLKPQCKKWPLLQDSMRAEAVSTACYVLPPCGTLAGLVRYGRLSPTGIHSHSSCCWTTWLGKFTWGQLPVLFPQHQTGCWVRMTCFRKWLTRTHVLLLVETGNGHPRALHLSMLGGCIACGMLALLIQRCSQLQHSGHAGKGHTCSALPLWCCLVSQGAALRKGGAGADPCNAGTRTLQRVC